MVSALRQSGLRDRMPVAVVSAGVLLGAFYLGQHPSTRWLGLIVVAISAGVLMTRLRLGLLALIVAALAIPLEIGTGTGVSLNPATLLLAAVLVLWLLDMMRRRALHLAMSRTTLPLLLFLLSGLFSLLIGMATWDPAIPRPNGFALVQLAQWGIFALSAGAFLLTANLASEELWLRRLTLCLLGLGGGLAIALELSGRFYDLVGRVGTVAFLRSPLWMLLAALSGGQLLFNKTLSTLARVALVAVLIAVFVFAFDLQLVTASTWVGVTTALVVLIWLRFPRYRWLVAGIVLILTVRNILVPTLWNLAGGDQEWNASGGSRLALSESVIRVTMRDPVFGLGPAAYRPYTRATPLYYNGIWNDPLVSAHNNYVDLFSQTGLVGLALFLWFVVEMVVLGLRLRRRFVAGFAAGYVNGMLAAGAGALVIMLLADWILPFVYNIGFPGFQASVLVWLFMGGLVALDNVEG